MSQIKQRIAYFESLRGLAAMVLVFFHLQANTALVTNALVSNAWLMLDFFFLLSGCVITMAFHHQMNTGAGISSFFKGRLLRLYPLHVLMLLVFLGFECIKFLATARLGLSSEQAAFSSNDLSSFVHNLFLTQMLFVDELTWNKPSWSISSEFWTYVAYAALAYSLRHSERLFLWASAILALSAFYFLYTHDMSAQHGLARSLYAFFVGVLISHVIRTSKIQLPTWTLNLSLTVTLVIICTGPWPYTESYSVFFSGIFIVLLLALFLTPEDGAVKRALSNRYLVRLGTISFGIYLIHSAVWWIMAQTARVLVRLFPDIAPEALQTDVLEVPWIANLILLIGVPLIIALGELSYRKFEKPIYDLRWKPLSGFVPQFNQRDPN
ncbi:acyltransferase family protein [Lentibacter sp. XHP0401]|jgi:peptidoglycan/LPS O-acetylase OafA/YrhL|uniref:acyltransferase family protein n=1 Tax=Lentibacter sp. XHP0401 TaxID=2984334 RepID=UPI0021E806A8|nr:acyltransferase [Lentibacter sp. XHP0401]MCV2893966.1 acyltransferase [Lentibacter sp. XHP0401]